MEKKDKAAHFALGGVLVLLLMLVTTVITYIALNYMESTQYEKMIRNKNVLGSQILELQKLDVEYTHFSCLPITDAVVLHSKHGQTLLQKANGNLATCAETLGINLKEVRVVSKN
jgi:ABC-type uncharacterized transport system YnjBCD permease subunit